MVSSRIHSLFAIAFLLLSTLTGTNSIAAQNKKIYFSVNEAASGANFKESGDLECNQPSDKLPIDGTYTVGTNKRVIIEGLDGNDVPYITCDEANDQLILKNARIRSDGAAGTVVKIGFWRMFVYEPRNSADYSVSADGTFYATSGTPSGSWIQLRGHVDNLDIGGFTWPPSNSPTCAAVLTKCATISPNSWLFNKNTVPSMAAASPVEPLADERTLRGRFSFKLAQNTHQIHFSTNQGIQVIFGPPPGPRPEGLTTPTCPEGQQCRSKCPDCEPFPKLAQMVIGVLAVLTVLGLWRPWVRRRS